MEDLEGLEVTERRNVIRRVGAYKHKLKEVLTFFIFYFGGMIREVMEIDVEFMGWKV